MTLTNAQKNILLFCIALAFASVAFVAFAQEETTVSDSDTPPPSISFPISELGNCASKSECKLYCDNATHREACFTFAQTHGLMNKDQVNTARVLLSKKGPGGCSSKELCKAYCENTEHAQECLTFAQTHNVVPPARLNIIKKILNEGGPGGCNTGEECRAYCSDAAHTEACRAFAQEHELMRPKPTSTQRMIEKRPLPPINASTTKERLGTSTVPKPCSANGLCPPKPGTTASSTNAKILPKPCTTAAPCPPTVKPPKPCATPGVCDPLTYPTAPETGNAGGAANTTSEADLESRGADIQGPPPGSEVILLPSKPSTAFFGVQQGAAVIYSGILYLLGL